MYNGTCTAIEKSRSTKISMIEKNEEEKNENSITNLNIELGRTNRGLFVRDLETRGRNVFYRLWILFGTITHDTWRMHFACIRRKDYLKF